MADERRALFRREFLSLVGLAGLAAACGQRLTGATTTTEAAVTANDLDRLPAVTSAPTIRRRADPTAGVAAPPSSPGPAGTSPTSTSPPATTGQAAPTEAPTTTPPSTTTSTTEAPATTTTAAPTTTVPPTTVPSTTTTSTTAPTTTTTLPTTTTVVAGPVSLHLEPRSAWGARDPSTDLLVPQSGSMNRLTVHHSGDNTSATGPRTTPYRRSEDAGSIVGRGCSRDSEIARRGPHP